MDGVGVKASRKHLAAWNDILTQREQALEAKLAALHTQETALIAGQNAARDKMGMPPVSAPARERTASDAPSPDTPEPRSRDKIPARATYHISRRFLTHLFSFRIQTDKNIHSWRLPPNVRLPDKREEALKTAFKDIPPDHRAASEKAFVERVIALRHPNPDDKREAVHILQKRTLDLLEREGAARGETRETQALAQDTSLLKDREALLSKTPAPTRPRAVNDPSTSAQREFSSWVEKTGETVKSASRSPDF
jgi:hypothetical protein